MMGGSPLDVIVEFGAKIDELVKGSESVKDKIGELQGHAEGVGETFKAIGEIMLAAFGVGSVAALIEKMAELGTETERTMAILGASSETVGRLSFIAASTGGSLESLALVTERMALNIQRANSNAFSPAAVALQKLGLSTKDFIGLSADQYLSKIADASSKFANDFDKAQLMMALGGRGMAALLPVIGEGSEGLKKLSDAADQTGSVLDHKTTQALVNVHRALVEAQAAFTGLAANLVAEFSPQIVSAVSDLTKLVETLTKLEKASKLADAALILFRTEIESDAHYVLMLGQVLNDIFVLDWGKISSDWDDGVKKIKAVLEQRAKEIKALLSDAVEPEADHHNHGKEKPSVGQLDLTNRDAVAAQMKEVEGEIKAIEFGLAQRKALYERDAALWQMTNDQKIALTAQDVIRTSALEMEQLEREKNIAGMSLQQKQEVENKIVDLRNKTNLQLIQLDTQSLLNQQRIWSQGMNMIVSSFNGQLRGLIAGTTSWADALKNIWQDLLVKLIEVIEKMAIEWAAGQLAQVTATTTAKTAQAAAEVAAPATTLPARIAKFTSDIVAAAAEATAGATAFFAPTLGPGAPAAGAAVGAEVMTAMAGVPKFASGAWEIDRDMFAGIHKGEMIIPAAAAQSIRDGGGGAPVQVSISTMDSRSMSQWLNGGGAAVLAKAVSRHYDRNPNDRPKF